jgi:hypothetical protein
MFIALSPVSLHAGFHEKLFYLLAAATTEQIRFHLPTTTIESNLYPRLPSSTSPIDNIQRVEKTCADAD